MKVYCIASLVTTAFGVLLITLAWPHAQSATLYAIAVPSVFAVTFGLLGLMGHFVKKRRKALADKLDTP